MIFLVLLMSLLCVHFSFSPSLKPSFLLFSLCTPYLPPSCLAHSVFFPRTAIRTTLIERFSPSAPNPRFHYSFLLIISAVRAPLCSPFIKNFSVRGLIWRSSAHRFKSSRCLSRQTEIWHYHVFNIYRYFMWKCVICEFNEQCCYFGTAICITCVSENKGFSPPPVKYFKA